LEPFSHLPLDHITIVLHRPRFAENIGSTARAAMNLGLRYIVLVNPEDTDRERMNKLATHAAAGLLEAMEIKPTLPEALAPFHFIVGTTARLGGERKQITTPVQAAQKILSLGTDSKVALLFGPENRGLSNEELRYCHLVVNIPTVQSSSLNLAQAVLIMAYEIFQAHRIPKEEGALPDPSGRLPDDRALKAQRSLEEPPLATSFELEGMYQHLAEVLQMMDFLDKQNPEHWMMSIRRFFSRVHLYSPEVRMIRGVCRQLKWFVKTQKDLARNNRFENIKDRADA
jgi:tRNA/rRNA methyltransferase